MSSDDVLFLGKRFLHAAFAWTSQAKLRVTLRQPAVCLEDTLWVVLKRVPKGNLPFWGVAS